MFEGRSELSDRVEPSARVEEERRAELANEVLAIFGSMVRRIRAALPEALQSELQDEPGGATPHQLEALHLLRHASGGGGAGLTMNELARRQACALSSASALADRLLREGLIERAADASDRRVVRLVPTARGDSLCRQFGAVKQRLMVETTQVLSVSEMETLVALLRKVVARSEPPPVTDVVHG